MTPNRCQWEKSQVSWVRRYELLHHDDATATFPENPPAWEPPKKNATDNWGGGGELENPGDCWTIPLKFEGPNREEYSHVFDWDDSGAVEVLIQGLYGDGSKPALADYLADCERYSTRIDWHTRRSCNLPDCAEALTREENRRKRKGYNSSSDNRTGRRAGSPVIIGLPEDQEEKENEINVIATGWGNEGNVIPTGWGDDPNVISTGWGVVPTGWGDESNVNLTPAEHGEQGDAQLDPSGLEAFGTPVVPSSSGQERVSCTQDPMDADSTRPTTFPSNLDSYKHIVPSGWGELPTSSGNPDSSKDVVSSGRGEFPTCPTKPESSKHVVPSGWGDLPEETRCTPDVGGGNYVALGLPEGDRPGDTAVRWNRSGDCGGLRYDEEKLGYRGRFKRSGPEYSKIKKRENDFHYGSGPLYRRNPQRSGRSSYANNMKASQDPSPSRANRWDRAKPSVWQATYGNRPLDSVHIRF
ncbi:hypothetical protein R1sor_010301 [Riccia sorocarpa]|uniref:Uncharacterized protein n=1 Tax=Riccia sorocarpa TaxID=122646 RepID=A0ABD3HXL8_9MARC